MNARAQLAQAVVQAVDAHIPGIVAEIFDRLKGGAVPPKRLTSSSPRTARSSLPPKGAKRDPLVIEATTDRLFAYVSKHGGQRIEQIAKAMGITTRELNLPVRKLIAARRIKTTGQKRATTYAAR